MSSIFREASRQGFIPDGFNPLNGLGTVPQRVERYSFLVSPLDLPSLIVQPLVTIMISRQDISKDIYLRLTASRFGYPTGLIGTVHTTGTDWSGNWYFQLRWLNRPTGKRNKPVSEWSLNLRDKDLEDFERIESWDQVQELLRESRPQRKPRRKARRPLRFSNHLGRVLRGKKHPNQLKLYEWD